MSSIKISELNRTSELNGGDLFVVVQAQSNKKLAFKSLSDQLTSIVDSRFGITVDRGSDKSINRRLADLGTADTQLTTKIGEVETSLRQCSVELSSKASDTKLGMVMLSSFDDDTTRNYGVRMDHDGHAYVHVPWKNSGGGTIQKATDDELGLIRTNEALAGEDGNYGLRLNAHGQAYVHVDVPVPYKYADVSSFWSHWAEEDPLSPKIDQISKTASDASISAAAAYGEIWGEDPETEKPYSKILDLQQTSVEHESLINQLSNDAVEISGDVFYFEGETRKSRVAEHTTDIASLKTTVEGQSTSITSLTGTVSTHTSDITELKTDVDQNAKDIAGLKTTVEGHTTTIGEHATAIDQNAKDIAELIVSQQVVCGSSYTVNAGSTLDVADVSIVKTSYQPISIVNIVTGGSTVVAGMRYINDNKAFFTLKNFGDAPATVTPTLTVIYMKMS